MKVLVIGANGTIGRRLVPRLQDGGHEVGVMLRSGSAVRVATDRLAVHSGDVRDRASVFAATAGYDVVYDLAIHPVTHWFKYRRDLFEEMYAINVRGARNVAEACLETGVKTLIYTSSSTTAGPAPNRELTTAADPFNGWELPHNYYLRTRILSEIEMLSAGSRGLDVRLLCPSGVFGAGVDKDHPPTKLIKKILNARTMISVSEVCIAGVTMDDVVTAHLRCLEHGYPGCKLLLTSRNITVHDFCKVVDSAAGKSTRLIEVPLSLLPGFARLSAIWTAFGDFSMTNPYNLEYLSIFGGYDNSETERALKMRFSDIGQAITAEVETILSQILSSSKQPSSVRPSVPAK